MIHLCHFSFDTQLTGGADLALDALSDTLKDIMPAPHTVPAVPTKDIVKVAKWMGVAIVCVSLCQYVGGA